jgi:hypothetical protein
MTSFLTRFFMLIPSVVGEPLPRIGPVPKKGMSAS